MCARNEHMLVNRVRGSDHVATAGSRNAYSQVTTAIQREQKVFPHERRLDVLQNHYTRGDGHSDRQESLSRATLIRCHKKHCAPFSKNQELNSLPKKIFFFLVLWLKKAEGPSANGCLLWELSYTDRWYFRCCWFVICISWSSAKNNGTINFLASWLSNCECGCKQLS